MKHGMLALPLALLLLLALLAPAGCAPRTHLAENTGVSKEAVFRLQGEGRGAEGQLPPAPLGSREGKVLMTGYVGSLSSGKDQGGASLGGGNGSETGLIPNLLPTPGGEEKSIMLGGE